MERKPEVIGDLLQRRLGRLCPTLCETLLLRSIMARLSANSAFSASASKASGFKSTASVSPFIVMKSGRPVSRTRFR